MDSLESAFAAAGHTGAYSILKNNGIVSLQILQDFVCKRRDKFEEWFPSIGVQLWIERLCSEGGVRNTVTPQSSDGDATKQNSTLTENSASTSTTNSSQSIAVVENSNENGQQAARVLVLAVENGPIAPIQARSTPQPTKKVYKSSKPEVVNFNLRALLESKPIGRCLLAIYKHKKKFSNDHQGLLVGLIVDYFTEILPDTLLLNEDLAYIAHLIVKEFKNEVITTYYSDPVPKKLSRDNKAKLSRGKLRQRFKNVWNFLLQAKKLENPTLDVSALEILDDTDSLDSDGQEAKVLLSCADEEGDEEEYKRLWDLCHSLRLQEIKDLLRRNITVVVKEYPILKYNKYQIL
ncbi:hypothetical protein QAD02_022988, partial [Eretmocerus hayati]